MEYFGLVTMVTSMVTIVTISYLLPLVVLRIHTCVRTIEYYRTVILLVNSDHLTE